ncbi:MAG: ABC transporter substrate-binding protein [Cyclobacteriaceae bacterium]
MNKGTILILFVLLTSCVKKQTEEKKGTLLNNVSYATAFHFEKIDSSEYLVVDEPWPKAQEKKTYDLSKPVKKVVCTSTSHLPFFELLGMEEVVIGFPNLKYISSEVFRKRAEEGFLTDLGPDGGMNMELLLSLNPDAVIAFDMGGESNTLDKIEEAGIPVFYNSDFLEKSPLGRAEWIKFFGALLNKREKADSIFNYIESEYNRLKEIGSNTLEKPTVLSGVVYGDTWFLPGGQNWASIFFENAGSEYLWQNDTTSGWLELSFEAVYETANASDFWIGTSTLNTRDEMLGQDERYGSFGAFQNDAVFSYNKKRGPSGGYDFFESGYSRPDLVLADLIKILHPELLTDYETVYFQKLE